MLGRKITPLAPLELAMALHRKVDVTGRAR